MAEATVAPVPLDRIVAEVAAAVDLREGEPGVRAVLRAIGRAEPAAVAVVSRAAGLPVPVVSAICNELRRHGVVSRQRPVRLTEEGRAALGPSGPLALATCPTCGGTGEHPPEGFEALLARLDEVAAEAAPVRVELDQTHCTAATKLRRALMLRDLGALDATSVLLLGDDDLTSVAIALLAEHLGERPPRDLVVIDVDPAVLDVADRRLSTTSIRYEVVRHDLRDGLPAALAGRFDVAFTDPPYTVEGARLMVSRAVEALQPGPSRQVHLAFGPKDPDTAAAVQRDLVAMGLVLRRLTPSFNQYAGAGVIGATSDQYHLVSSAHSAPLVTGSYEGPLYTADAHRAPRRYECTTCKATYLVGADEPVTTVAQLKAQRCPACGGERFRPGSLVG